LQQTRIYFNKTRQENGTKFAIDAHAVYRKRGHFYVKKYVLA